MVPARKPCWYCVVKSFVNEDRLPNTPVELVGTSSAERLIALNSPFTIYVLFTLILYWAHTLLRNRFGVGQLLPLSTASADKCRL